MKLIFYKALSLKLHSFNSVVDKLEFLKTVYIKYKNLPENSITVASLVEKLKFGHFPDKNVKLSLWFLEAHANYHFNKFINNEDFQRRLASKEKVFHIKTELKKILKIEKNARKLQETGAIIYDQPYRDDNPSPTYLLKGLSKKQIKKIQNPDYKQDIYEFIINDVNYMETLRVLDRNYYTTRPTEYNYNVHGSPAVMAYFRHVLLKQELIKMLSDSTEQTLDGQKSGNPATPENFEDLFYKPESSKVCLRVLQELDPPTIDANNNYIGKAKGIFPLWIKVLKNYDPPLIKHFSDQAYKTLLNEKITGLNLTDDASEFRKHYKRLANDKVALDIKAKLSQFSQEGKLGK